MNIAEQIEVLCRFGNIVLEGVPGAGKTYAAKEIATAWQRVTGRPVGSGGLRAVTLHPSTAYEDFVEGLRPIATAAPAPGNPQMPAQTGIAWFYQDLPPVTGAVPFGIRNGFFLDVCSEAINNPHQDWLVLIDEINRANVPKVFGDLLTTMEASKRVQYDTTLGQWKQTEALTVELPYSHRLFYVPANVYVIATMNSSDRSVAALDSALRRRFAFITVPPLPRAHVAALLGPRFGTYPGDPLPILPQVDRSLDVWNALNHDFLRPFLGPDAMLGHSYLLDTAPPSNVASEPWNSLCRRLADPTIAVDGLGWFRRAASTGGSNTQQNIPMPVAEHVFGGVDAAPGEAIGFDVTFRGQLLTGNSLKQAVNGNNPSGSWGWTYSATPLGDEGRLTNDMFYQPLLSVCRIVGGPWELREHPAADLTRLKGLGGVVDVTTNGREFGLPEIQQARDAVKVDFEQPLRDLWRFALLPQLGDTLAAAGALDALSSAERNEWFDGHAPSTTPVAMPAGPFTPNIALAKGALDGLVDLCRSLGIGVEVVGAALGRALVVT